MKILALPRLAYPPQTILTHFENKSVSGTRSENPLFPVFSNRVPTNNIFMTKVSKLTYFERNIHFVDSLGKIDNFFGGHLGGGYWSHCRVHCYSILASVHNIRSKKILVWSDRNTLPCNAGIFRIFFSSAHTFNLSQASQAVPV